MHASISSSRLNLSHHIHRNAKQHLHMRFRGVVWVYTFAPIWPHRRPTGTMKSQMSVLICFACLHFKLKAKPLAPHTSKCKSALVSAISPRRLSLYLCPDMAPQAPQCTMKSLISVLICFACLYFELKDEPPATCTSKCKTVLVSVISRRRLGLYLCPDMAP